MTAETVDGELEKPAAKVWGYVRVSTDAQEDGNSLEAQEKEIRAYAKEQNLAEPTIVVEIASAGKPMLPVSLPGQKNETTTSPRPLFLALLGELCETRGSHLIVWKLDRFARVQYEQEMLLELLRRRGVVVHSVQVTERQLLSGDTDGGGDPARVFFRQIMGAVAQYERAIIRLRMGTGLRMKASKGGWAGGGPPYGYRAEKKELEVVPAEAEIVRYVFYLREQQGLSYNLIAQSVLKRFPSELAKDWYKVRVARIIGHRGLYSGVYSDPFGGSHPRPDLRMLPETWDDYIESEQPPQAEDLERMPTYEEP